MVGKLLTFAVIGNNMTKTISCPNNDNHIVIWAGTVLKYWCINCIRSVETIRMVNSTIGSDLDTWQEQIRQINIDKGWRGPRGEALISFGEAVALLHSEVSEALDVYRDCGFEDQTKTSGEDYQQSKPEGVGSELADVLIRLLDTCDMFKIDLTAEIHRKLQYNARRSYRHGGKLL